MSNSTQSWQAFSNANFTLSFSLEAHIHGQQTEMQLLTFEQYIAGKARQYIIKMVGVYAMHKEQLPHHPSVTFKHQLRAVGGKQNLKKSGDCEC